MRDLPNTLEKSLKANQEFQEEVFKALEELFDSNPKYIVKTQKNAAKIFHDKEHNQKYLIVQSDAGAYTVYVEQVSDYNRAQPFQHIKERLRKDEETYAPTVLSVALPQELSEEEHEDFKTALKEFQTLMSSKTQDTGELVEALLQNSSARRALGQFSSTSSPYVVRSLGQFLLKEKVLTAAWDDKVLATASTAAGKYIPSLTDMTYQINFFFDMCAKHKLTAKKKFVFNDLDNKIWAQKTPENIAAIATNSNTMTAATQKAVLMQDQNSIYYMVRPDDKNYAVYGVDISGENYKKHKELKALIEELSGAKVNNTRSHKSLLAVDSIDTVILEVKDGAVVFADNAWLQSLLSNFKFTKMALEKEYKEAPQYPVDLTDYDYQKNYYHKRYGFGEFEFVVQAVFTLGGGFDYDSKKGTFVDKSIGFDPNLGNDYPYPAKPTEIKKFNYCYPKSFTHLDAKWKKGVEYVLEVLKRDMPVPLASNTQDKAQDVRDAIIYLEKRLKTLAQKEKKSLPLAEATKVKALGATKPKMK